MLSFNAPSIATVSSVIDPMSQYSIPERRAAACAILRHNIHLDVVGTGEGAKENGGLDPRYYNLHGVGGARGPELEEKRAVVSETFRDALDTVSHFLLKKGQNLKS